MRKMNNDAFWIQIGALATLFMCVMTLLTFGITTGMWESDFWHTDLEGASIVGYDGDWGEDIIVVYTDGTTESVKGISNNYWETMTIQDEGSKPISTIQYCINVLLPTSDIFDTLTYRCDISIVQNGINFYQIPYTTTDFIEITANEWTRIITVPLDIQNVSSGWDNGTYSISFENAGTIEGIEIPDGRSIDIAIEEGVVTFLI